MKKSFWIIFLLLAAAGIFTVFLVEGKLSSDQSEDKPFDGQRAYQDLAAQVNFGPRIPGSAAHDRTVQYIDAELTKAGWLTERQKLYYEGHQIENVIARRGTGSPLIILGAHYDTRLVADRDPDPTGQTQPVPGASDGASGVAVLLELSRILPEDIRGQIWLTFFDAEDQGNLPGWEWILGSRAFVSELTIKPDAVVIVDMVGDSSLSIYQEKNSNPELVTEIWNTAATLGYQKFIIPEEKYGLLDDHTPFLENGIPAVDMIDFVYPYWHTTQDNLDKVSADSLKIVGDTIQAWIFSKISVGKN